MKVRSKIKIIKEISLVYKLKDIRKKRKEEKFFWIAIVITWTQFYKLQTII